ncbi:MAG TPA: GNAT family N-acetyltransferase [Glaciibacter sp.]|nr:GNAT family N-acetyltransferase [Glaciibacter sp.]
MSEYTIESLTPDTFESFAALGGKHNGVWGGCWCTWFHPNDERPGTFDGNREFKRRLVAERRAHAALVFDGNTCVAWCQYGPATELPRIYHRKDVEAEGYAPPDYRITCFFVDRDHRRRGVAAVALRGALDLIAQSGGGFVEAYPQDTQGKKTSASFLYNGTRHLFEEAGFEYERSIGKNHCLMRTEIAATADLARR